MHFKNKFICPSYGKSRDKRLRVGWPSVSNMSVRTQLLSSFQLAILSVGLVLKLIGKWFLQGQASYLGPQCLDEQRKMLAPVTGEGVATTVLDEASGVHVSDTDWSSHKSQDLPAPNILLQPRPVDFISAFSLHQYRKYWVKTLYSIS